MKTRNLFSVIMAVVILTLAGEAYASRLYKNHQPEKQTFDSYDNEQQMQREGELFTLMTADYKIYGFAIEGFNIIKGKTRGNEAELALMFSGWKARKNGWWVSETQHAAIRFRTDDSGMIYYVETRVIPRIKKSEAGQFRQAVLSQDETYSMHLVKKDNGFKFVSITVGNEYNLPSRRVRSNPSQPQHHQQPDRTPVAMNGVYS